MTNDLPAAPAAPELHLHSFDHALGDPVGIALLDDPGVSGRLDSLTAEGMRHCRVSERSAPHLGAAGARAALAPADGLVPGTAVLATAAQMPEEMAYSPHHATHSHCYSADQLITLAALKADGRLTHGRRVLLLASSARSWSLTALERVGPTRRDAAAGLTRSMSPRQGARGRAGSTL